jgi:hypothetical protein
MVAQAAVGVAGVRVDAGIVTVDPSRLDPLAEVITDTDGDAFGGLRAFLTTARGRRGFVKWQVTGPVTLGMALARRGGSPSIVFDVALAAVRARIAHLQHTIAAALPDCRQVVMVDEPGMSGLTQPGFALDPDRAIDLVSGALAAVEGDAIGGTHCCGSGDWAAILAAGPAIVSLPVQLGVLAVAGHLADFLDAGGWVAWGAIPTDRPVGPGPDHWWRELAETWCELVQRGCDPVRLRNQALVTPACGLALHDVAAAEHILTLVADLAERVHGQAVATRLSIGA